MARKSKDTALKAVGPQTESPPVAVITPNEAISHFRDSVVGYNRQSIMLACSAAVCFIVGTHSGVDAIDQEAMIAKLKKEVNDLGLATAQTAKYIGLARAITNHLMFRFKVGGPIHEVLQAINTSEAIQIIVDYLGKQKVKTLEDLTVMFNKYRRKKKAKGKNGAEQPSLVPAAGEHEDALPMNGASSQGEISVTKSDTHVDLYSVTTIRLVETAIKCGHVPVDIAAGALAFVTSEADLERIALAVQERSSALQQRARAVA